MSKYDKLLGEGWARILGPFLKSDEFKKIGKTLKELSDSGTRIYPLFDDMFKAFKECPYHELTTVFLTTNPYTKESDGIAFSSSEKTSVLNKIFDAIEEDVADGLYLNRETDLTRLSNQGVLLLNLNLSVDVNKKIDHLRLWEPFIDYLMKTLAEYNTGIIYVLIGKEAKKYVDYINVLANDFYVIEHPMVAVIKNRPWKYNKIFSDINRISGFINNKKILWTT